MQIKQLKKFLQKKEKEKKKANLKRGGGALGPLMGLSLSIVGSIFNESLVEK